MCNESYCEITVNGNKFFYKNGTNPHKNFYHRTDGPAVEWANGHKEWWINATLHREDGPAIEYFGGTKKWFFNNKLHREDGPAIEWSNGMKDWFINNKEYSEKEYWKLIKLKAFM